MQYVSTRGGSQPMSFCEILLAGLASDGGLYVPEYYPKFSGEDLDDLRSTYASGADGGYARLAFAILSRYIDDIPPPDLARICSKTYTEEIFGDSAITPVTPYNEDGFTIYLQGLSNGPTLAFKDVALQLVGNLFEYELARRGEELNVLGATSGDTGSAAEYALRGKKGIRVFMLSPHGRMSPFQQAQMYSLQDENIFNIAVEGTFDEAQAVVKEVSSDAAFKKRYSVGAVNSINWARILAQVVYYFAGYFQSTQSSKETRAFAVPSGNFGNAFAGHVARMMGLPVSSIIIATNENDVLYEFFRTGVYRPRSKSETLATTSPSMDISLASNLERLIHAWFGSEMTYSMYVDRLPARGQFNVSEFSEFAEIKKKLGFVSGKSTHADRLRMIRQVCEKCKIIIDPHTADAWKVATEHDFFYGSVIVLETALAAKFAGTTTEALGFAVPIPEHLKNIEDLPRRVEVLPPNTDVIKRYIANHCA